MTCVTEIHVDDVNTRFVLTISEDCLPIDISTYDVLNIIFTKPDGTSVVQTAQFVTDGTDGQIYYSTIAGDIDQAGIWKIQGKVGVGSGTLYRTPVNIFKVYCNL